MIDKETPILAFDVSKGSSHCQAFYSFGKPSGRPIRVAHCKSGMAAVAEIAETLTIQTGKKPKVILESTGVYSEPVLAWAESVGLEAFLVSPLESAKVRKSKIRPTKTDALDCGVIAEVAYTRSLRRHTPRSLLYSRLYSLSRRRAVAVGRLVQSKGQYLRNLDSVWPLFDKACDPFSGFAMFCVKKYRHPERLRRAGKSKFANVLANAAIKLGPASREAIAERLVAYAEDALSGCESKSASVDALVSSLDELEHDMAAADELTERLISAAKGLPCFPQIASIDGVGPTLASLLCAEIGDPSRFSSKRGLVAYAGLDPTILQSGRNGGLHYSITKKGNPFLREYLFLAVQNMLILKRENSVTEFYAKKKSSGLCHKAAATAACRKLLACIWGMLRSGTFFEK